MIDKYPKYLPIGTVLMLKKGQKRLMITGYAQIDMESAKEVYDYCGCPFPEGVLKTKETILFNHKDIEKLYCIGYSDEEQKEFSEKLKNILTEENIKEMLKTAQEVKTTNGK